jgi:ABC-type phosphate transport system auxiliary subunit
VKQINEYQDILANKKAERDRLTGRQDALYDELQKEGFDSLEEADEELAKIDTKITSKETEMQTLKADFEKKFGAFLNG